MEIESKYYDITSEIDARAILRYLNELGIKNVSGEMLKHFITDLKKYIKYDLNKKYKTEEFIQEWPERLHSATTFSSRLRSKTQENIPCQRHCQNKSKGIVRNVHSAPNLNENNIEKPPRRACSCIPVDRRKEPDQKIEIKRSTVLSNNLIKVPIKLVQKKSDPVSLYHYYLSMWEKYKSNVPGENKWSDLRWSVRQKMAGCVESNNLKKVSGKPSKSS